MIFSWGTFFLLLVVFGLFLGSLSAAVARRALGGAEFFSLRPHPLGSILGILLVLWLFFHALVEVSALHGTPLVEYILYNTPLDFLRLWPSWWKGALGGILLAGVTTTVTLTDLWEMRIPFRLSG
ncbi:MAG: hypothetical protein KM296_00295, partial [Brockia lithotrophica]|nr:hypothetical protein [Brockia lithotrophica]